MAAVNQNVLVHIKDTPLSHLPVGLSICITSLHHLISATGGVLQADDMTLIQITLTEDSISSDVDFIYLRPTITWYRVIT